jgi:hypothetical protein
MRKPIIKMVTGEVWERISAVCRRGERKYIAISYLGDGAADLLHLSEGDCLVTDLSDLTIRAGATNPREALRALLRHNIDIYSVENLHAKVVACGSVAIVGSANASRHSQQSLLEACTIIGDAVTAQTVRKWIMSLLGERVGEEVLRRKIRLMPKRRGRAATGRKKVPAGVPIHAPLWLVSTKDLEHFYAEHEEDVHERSATLKKERARRGYDVIPWQWTGVSRFIERVKPGDQIIEIEDGDYERRRVYEPQTVLEIQRRRHNGRRVTYLQLERRVDGRSFSFKSFARRANGLGVHVARRPRRLVADAAKAHGLRQLFLARA